MEIININIAKTCNEMFEAKLFKADLNIMFHYIRVYDN